MDALYASEIFDGTVDVDEGTYVEAAQYLIDSGLWLQLQGRIGRECARLIERGDCQPPEHDQRDYWGNVVKGSSRGNSGGSTGA